jgi:hypothetical protein
MNGKVKLYKTIILPAVLYGGEWRKLHNEEFHNLYPSPDIIRQIKSRRMRWAGHVARMGEKRELYKVLVGEAKKKRDHSEDQVVGGRMG